MSGAQASRAALWGATAALVASAHVAVAAWAMRHQPEALQGPPEPIEIELAPAPAEPAPASSDADAIPDTAEADAPAPDFTPPPIEPLPPPDMAQLLPPDAAAEVAPPDFTPPPIVPLPPADFAALAPATPSPAPPPKKRPQRIVELARAAQPTPEPQQQREQPRKERRAEPTREQPRTEQRREAARAQQSSGEARGRSQSQAPSGAQGQPGRATAKQVASWESKVRQRIAAHMLRTSSPGRGGVSGVVHVTIQPNGGATAQIARGSGDARTDAALQRQARRMPKLPPPPGGRPVSVTIPFSVK